MNTSIGIDKIKNGMNYCIENSKQLITDAELLLENNRFPRAYSITQLAIEEIGKAMMLYGIYNSLQLDIRKEIDFKLFRKNFRDHKRKTSEATMIDLMMHSEIKVSDSDFKEFALNNFKEIRKANNGHYDKLKNDGFYVSIENDKFSKPNEIFNYEDTLDFLNKSKLKIDFASNWIQKWLKMDAHCGVDKEGIIHKLK